MKNLLAFTALFVVILCLPAVRAEAADVTVSGQAANLAYRMPEVIPDERVIRLKAFLESYNSPLADEAKAFVEEADRNNLDWKLVAAISGVESTFGLQIPVNSYNAWGWGIPTGAKSGIGFASWQEGITTVSEGLAKNYYGRGAKTLYDVGWIYAANGNSWGTHVLFYLNKLTDFQPLTPAQLPVSI
jgi:hypothetical protein